jgi:WD40 repeat protein
MPQRLRIFVSSPADVPNERLRADLIVDKLAQDYGRFFAIESYRWEHEAMLASAHFQDAIEPPSAFDIVVLILWSRLGTPLPEKTAEREYRGIDGRVPVTGTEWEYEEALKAAREKKAPDLLAFRNISPAPIDPRDAGAQAASMAQLGALNAFWTRHFADRGVFLAAYDEYRTLEEFAQRLEESLRKLIVRRIKDLSGGGTASTAAVWTGDPFRGLESYEFEHAPIFFGRDAAVTKATEQLAVNARSGRAFLLVSGASGSGKSSLVKAGIVPRLMKPQRISGMAFLRRAVFRPGGEGADIILGLAKALTRAGDDNVGLPELIGPRQDAGQLAAYLRSAPDNPDFLFASALDRLTDAERRSGRLLAFEEAKLILVVDQLEELFTVPGISSDERRLFIQLLASLARSGTVWVIATLRADFWHRAADIPDLVALAEGQGRIDLAAPSPAELAEMIRRPAQAAGLPFETHAASGLGLDAVLAEHAAAAPGALPLLSFTLDELYRSAKSRGSTVLTHASYEALGGLEGAIANRADEIMAGLSAPAQAALPRVLRALTTVTGTTDHMPVARSASLESFAAGSPARTLIDAFIAARLLVAASESGSSATVRLAHEALISRWQRARDQLVADRRDLETRTFIERQFERWSQAPGGARRQLLLRNPDLANASDLARRWGDELDAPVRDFIKRSASRARLAQTLTAVAAVVFAVVAGAAVYAERQAARAQQEAEAQSLRALAEVAMTEQLRGDLDGALRLGVHAARLDFREGQNAATASQARAALAAALSQSDWRVSLSADDSDSRGVVRFATFSPDGSRIAAVSGNRVIVWDSASGKEILDVGSDVNCVAFSPDGTRIVAALDDKNAVVLDAAVGKVTVVLRGHEDHVLSATFSPDGSRIVTASDDKTARVWDAATGKAIAVLSGHESGVASAAYSPDGTRIVTVSGMFSGQDNTARIWQAATGKEIMMLRGHEGPVRSAAFSPDGSRIVTASLDHTARIWDAATGKQITVFRGHENDVESAVFSPDGARILTASDDKTARIWDAANGKEIAVLLGHENYLTSAIFSPDGSRIVTASGDGTARIWDAATRKAIEVLRGHEGSVRSAAFSPDGKRVVTASQDATARVWDSATGQDIAVLRGHEGDVVSAAFSPDGTRIVTASGSVATDRYANDDNTARIWDAATGTELAILRGHEGPVHSAVFSPDGSRIVTASNDNTARIWDAANGKEIAVLRGDVSNVVSAVFSPDGTRIVTASSDWTARIWDAASENEIAVLRGDAPLRSAAYSPDGTRIATASDDKTVRIWDAATGKEIVVLRGHESMVNSAVFSTDGTRIVTASGSYSSQNITDNTARIWDAATGKEMAVLRGHQGYVTSAAFSPDGSRIVTASDDKTARIWEAATGKELATLRGHESAVTSAAFSPDGTRVLTASADGTARIWDVHFATMSANSLIAEVCMRRLRGLTTLRHDEMLLAGYPETAAGFDVCAGVE